MRSNKIVLFLLVALFSTCSSLLSAQVTLLENTQVQMKFNQDVREKKNKLNESVSVVVLEDVKAGSTVVIPKGTSVRATITNAKRGEIRVDIYDLKAVDGSKVELQDCWVFTTAAQNFKGKGALILNGTRKNCFVKAAVNINAK